MLRNTNDLEGFAIGATDGVIGHVKDLYFDDEAWTVRYFVVEAGSWLSSRKVLISPLAAGKPSASEKILPISLTREKVKNSPDIDTDKPVSRQHETDYLGYYGYPIYWGAVGFWGAGVYPGAVLPSRGYDSPPDSADSSTAPVESESYADSHLRSCKTVSGYNVHASDGDIGHVQGVLIDDETWAVRYLVVDTSNWWLGHKVIIAPQWIDNVNWFDATVSINLTRQSVKDSPAYVHTEPLSRPLESALYEHYDRPSYWSDALKRDTDISRI